MMFLQRIGVAAATVLLLATPALAQEAGDCDLVCRLKGYLSTDHMAGDHAGEAPAAGPAKTRRQRAAAAHKAATPSKAVAAAVPATTARKPAPVVEAVPPKPTAPHTAPDRIAVAAPPPAARRVKPAPAKVVATLPAPTSIDRPEAPSTRSPTAAEEARPAPLRSAAARRRVAVQARAVPSTGPEQTASLATSIPGSSPAMQAGFH